MSKRGFSKHPVGAIWKGENPKTGKRATIWLHERNDHFEIWYWSWSYRDGSSPVWSFDWGTSYRMCKDLLPFSCRMKRVG